MAERKTATDRLGAAFKDPDKAATFISLVFDYVVDQPVSRYIQPERVLEHLDRALADEPLTRAVETHGRPFLDRERERAKARKDTVGDWLTAEAKAELRTLAARPVKLSKRFLDGLVQQGAVKHMLRSVIEETLQRFLATLKPGGSGGGMLGALGRGAMGLAGGLGKTAFAVAEEQLGKAASTFLAGSMNLMLERLVAILSSPETAAQLGRLNLQAFEEVQKLQTRVVLEAMAKLPLDDLAEIVPGLVAHNLARPEIRQGILDEVAAWLAIEGEKPVRALLDEAAATDAWRDELTLVGVPLLAELAATDGFRRWLATL